MFARRAESDGVPGLLETPAGEHGDKQPCCPSQTVGEPPELLIRLSRSAAGRESRGVLLHIPYEADGGWEPRLPMGEGNASDDD